MTEKVIVLLEIIHIEHGKRQWQTKLLSLFKSPCSYQVKKEMLYNFVSGSNSVDFPRREISSFSDLTTRIIAARRYGTNPVSSNSRNLPKYSERCWISATNVIPSWMANKTAAVMKR
jgi:hypothetical protein